MSTSSPMLKPGTLRRGVKWLIGVALVFACLIASILWRHREPSFAGKGASEWFAESLVQAPPGPNNDMVSSSERAFVEMEGDVIPFLAQWLNARPSAADNAYARMISHLPGWVRGRLPTPRADSYFDMRESKALMFLGLIGKEQRFKSDVGQPSTKIPISAIVPQIRAVLTNTNRGKDGFAAQSLWEIGPAAVEAVPDLIKLAGAKNNYWSAPVAIQAFGTIGPGASNAVDLLAGIAAGSSYRDVAVRSLGGIGVAAKSAVPVLVKLLNGINYPMRIAAALSLGEIGLVPDDALPPLLAMREKPDPVLSDGINERVRTAATFALWVHEPDNLQFKSELIETLRSKERRWLIFSLARLGPKAAPFAPEITKLTQDPDPNIRRLARTALRRIQP